MIVDRSDRQESELNESAAGDARANEDGDSRAPFHYHRRVEWADTDAAGIAHFTALMRYMEEAEHALLREVGLSVSQRDNKRHVSWPRVSAKADFRGPVAFGDVVDVDVRILQMGGKSITYGFDLSHDGRPVAKGSVTAVCCEVGGDRPVRSIPIPDWFRERIAPYAGDVGPSES